ncbi:hypothetical protein [Dermatophilus congolensis]|nr:hypothetical protein [Dermatophilus congolensis]
MARILELQSLEPMGPVGFESWMSTFGCNGSHDSDLSAFNCS